MEIKKLWSAKVVKKKHYHFAFMHACAPNSEFTVKYFTSCGVLCLVIWEVNEKKKGGNLLNKLKALYSATS